MARTALKKPLAQCFYIVPDYQREYAWTDIAFCGQGGVLAGSDNRAANQDGAVRPAPWATILTLPPALTVLPGALSLVCAVLLWLLLEPKLMGLGGAAASQSPDYILKS